ncbi:MAG: tetratricopeptide repeat protein [Anaerolineales bacterium]|nr:tetratricopeptide repeat protein [Anaerolineales bacterium]
MFLNDSEFQKWMNEGYSAAWDQDWAQAEACYRRALKINSRSQKALINLGLALFEQNRLKEALKYYLGASQLEPEDPVPLEKCAEILESLGEYKKSAERSMLAADLYLKIKEAEKAIENWSRVVRVMPEYLPAHQRLAYVHEKYRRKEQAITEYVAVAALLQHAGKVNEAIATVNHAIEIDPESHKAKEALRMLQGRRLLPKPSLKQTPKSISELPEPGRTGRKMDDFVDENTPDPVTEAKQKAKEVLAAHMFDLSEDISAGGIVNSPDGRGPVMVTGSLMAPGPDKSMISLYLGQAINSLTREDVNDAADQLSSAIDVGLDHPAAYFTLGTLLKDMGEFDLAQRSFTHSIKHPDYSIASRLMIANAHFDEDRLSEAVEDYLEALKDADALAVSPEQADGLRQLYEPLIEAYSREENEEKLRNICSNIQDILLQSNWRSHVKRARGQIVSSNKTTVPRPLAEILTEVRSSAVVEALSNINQLAREGKFHTAMEFAYSVLDRAPTYLPLHIQMGEILLKQESTSDAIQKFTVVAQSYSVRGEGNRATEIYRRIVNIAPMDLAARTFLIDQLVERGEFEEAINEYKELADVYYRLAELDMARATYKQALRLAQQYKMDVHHSIEILHHMADIDLQKLDWRHAVRVYEQIRSIDLDDLVSRQNLIDLNMRLGNESKALLELDNYMSHLGAGGRDDEALFFLENLVEQNESYLFALRRLAEFYLQALRKDDAILHWDKLGEKLLEVGDTDGAIEAVRTIISLRPANIEKYQQLLGKLQKSIT